MASVAGIDVRLIRDASQIPLSAQQWNELLGRNETNTIFQTFEWFEAWWRTFGDAHRLFFLLVSRGGNILGFAPFMLTRGALGRPRLEFAGTGNADYQDLVLPIDKREAVAAICAFLRTSCADWHRAWLCNIPSHSSTLRLLEEEGRRQGLYLVEERLCRALSCGSRASARPPGG